MDENWVLCKCRADAPVFFEGCIAQKDTGGFIYQFSQKPFLKQFSTRTSRPYLSLLEYQHQFPCIGHQLDIWG